jgi:hypothetical protein
MDPNHFVRTGPDRKGSSSFKELSDLTEGWAWVDPAWKLVTSKDTDKEGWVYSTSFMTIKMGQAYAGGGMAMYVRRRTWVRLKRRLRGKDAQLAMAMNLTIPPLGGGLPMTPAATPGQELQSPMFFQPFFGPQNGERSRFASTTCGLQGRDQALTLDTRLLALCLLQSEPRQSGAAKIPVSVEHGVLDAD